jgi:flagellin-specific chaperone FliS
LEPLQDEALKIIGGLAVMQGMVKQVEKDCEENLVMLMTQVIEEILEMEAEAKKEVATARETLQKFMESWKGVMQQA